MGHYDTDNTGPSRAEISRRHRAHDKKKAQEARDRITDEEIRDFLFLIRECGDCGTECCDEHAKDVMYDMHQHDAAAELARSGVHESKYDALPMKDEVNQLKQMAIDEDWVAMGLGDYSLTDEGHEIVMMDLDEEEIERTRLQWDEEAAQKWNQG